MHEGKKRMLIAAYMLNGVRNNVFTNKTVENDRVHSDGSIVPCEVDLISLTINDILNTCRRALQMVQGTHLYQCTAS